MAKVFFDNPMNLSGSNEEKLRQLYGYLFTMSEKLNEALNTITVEQMEPETKTIITKASGAAETAITNYSTLKALIIKTANIVRNEMEEIGTQLHGEVTAVSEQFGTLEQNLDATITATAEGILQNYSFDEKIEANEEVTGLKGFRNKISQYIFTGLLSTNPAKYGVAIGENVTIVEEDGSERLNTDGKMATFTMDELAFYSSGNKVAWFSNSTFYIANGQINTSLQMGENHMWRIMANGALALVALTARPSPS